VSRPAVIVTRPAPAGERLREKLVAAGWEAHAWPAFRIGPAPDAAAVHATLARLADFDLAVFVSPAAVRAVALWIGTWPAGTLAGAVGEATAAELRTAMRLPPGALLAPSDDAAGSEAFWEAVRQRGLSPRRVLILRAQHGREWLGEKFAAAGAQVRTLAVYTRSELVLDADAREALAAAVLAQRPAAVVFSSSEAVEALDRQIASVAGADAWLRAGTALATHPRIAARLLAAGYTRAIECEADDDAVLAQLESLAAA
jgi:uroporphyrinogen-III synthase